MKTEYIHQLIKQGEGLTIEFKTAQHDIPKNIFETVCAFLNRVGGTLLLGVADNGEIVGVEQKYVQKIKKELANALNNPQLINPPVYIQPQEIEIDDKVVLLLQVYESSQVHNTRGLIFDRNHEGDYNITLNTNLVASLYIRKQSTFTENKIYPYATIKELRPEIIHRVRQMAVNRQPGHLWESMTDMELLRSVQLYQTDYSSGKEGFTLAAILLFGRDDVISSVLPFHKTDAICRIHDLNRFDDRDDVRTNLIESYDRLMRFVENHLPDKFVLKGDVRISVRNLIFREIIANTLIHREYTNPFPAKLVIGVNNVYTENANKSHGELQLQPDNFSPFPKNPVIARVFKEIGRADELGSGVRNIFEYYQYYSKHKPILEEQDIFKCTVFIDDTLENYILKSEYDNLYKSIKDDGINETIDEINDELSKNDEINDEINVGLSKNDVINDEINENADMNDEIKEANDEINKKDELLNSFKQIVEILNELPEITIPELALKTGMSTKTTERNLSKLKELGIIQRVGSRKTGSWIVISKT